MKKYLYSSYEFLIYYLLLFIVIVLFALYLMNFCLLASDTI